MPEKALFGIKYKSEKDWMGPTFLSLTRDNMPNFTRSSLTVEKEINKHCKLLSCNKLFMGPKKKKFCSTNCRVKQWNKRHPRTGGNNVT